MKSVTFGVFFVPLYYYPRVSSIFTKNFLCALCLLCSAPRSREFTAESQRTLGLYVDGVNCMTRLGPNFSGLKHRWAAKKAECAEKIPLFSVSLR